MKKFLQFLLIPVLLLITFAQVGKAYQCGESFKVKAGESTSGMCECSSTNNQAVFVGNVWSEATYCCGFYTSGKCRPYEDPNAYTCGETNRSASIPDGATCNCPGGQWESYWQSEFWNNRGVCCGWTTEDRKQCLSEPPGTNDVYCGSEFDPQSEKKCICSFQEKIEGRTSGDTQCCGWMRDGKCQSTDVGINDVEVTAETLNSLNPINIGSGSADLKTPGGIISRALKFFIFPIAGIILFVVLILGGFQMLAGANNSKSLDEGKQRITTAIIGFILLFAAYWIAQLLEIIFGIRILS